MMLRDILKIINRTGYISRSQLAGELNVSREIVDEEIDQLLRMGYLLEADTGEDCSTSCNKCPFAKNCGKRIVKTFKISAKGGRFLTRFKNQRSI